MKYQRIGDRTKIWRAGRYQYLCQEKAGYVVLNEDEEEETTFILESAEDDGSQSTMQRTARMSTGSAPPETLRRSRRDGRVRDTDRDEAA